MIRVIKIIAVLTITAIISGLSLSFVYQVTEPKIKENALKEIKSAIKVVVPAGEGNKKDKIGEVEFYHVMNKAGDKVGYAFIAEGTGFMDKIQIMVGADKDLTKLTGIKILSQVETPGLGAKIEEDWFTTQFKGLNITKSLEAIKGAKPSNDNEIAAITGATISSKHVTRIINEQLAKLRKSLGK